MSTSETDIWIKVGWGIYALLGAPVVWYFIRDQKMTESVKQSETSTMGQSNYLVRGMLLMMWPILLFALIVNRLQPPPKRKADKGERASDSDSKSNQSPSELGS